MSATLRPATSATTESSGHAMAWSNPPLSTSKGVSAWARFGVPVVILLGAVLDAALLKPVFDLILDTGEWESWGIAIVLSVVAAVAQFVAGRITRGHRGNGRPGWPVSAALIVVVWLIVGIGVAIARLVKSQIAVAVQVGATATSTSQAVEPPEFVAAGLFLALYLLVGILAFSDGFEARQDAWSARRNVERELAALHPMHVDGERYYRRLSQYRGLLGFQLGSIDRARIEAERDNASIGAEAKAYARQAIALLHRDVAITGITSPDHPDHPANPGHQPSR